MALGAQAAVVLRMVMKEGLGLAAAGALLGLGGALLFSRVFESLRFGVTAREPIHILSAYRLWVTIRPAHCFS